MCQDMYFFSHVSPLQKRTARAADSGSRRWHAPSTAETNSQLTQVLLPVVKDTVAVLCIRSCVTFFGLIARRARSKAGPTLTTVLPPPG